MSCKLSELNSPSAARITALNTAGPMRRRLQDLGFVPGASVRFLYDGFGGGIRAYGVGGSVIALRHGDAEGIIIEKAEDPGE